MSERRFIVTKEEDTFLLGHFEGEQSCGVYLSPDYLNRLGEIRNAVATRLDTLGISEIPDALKNLLGVIDHLLTTHADQSDASGRKAIELAQRELEEAMEALSKFTRPPNDPEKK